MVNIVGAMRAEVTSKGRVPLLLALVLVSGLAPLSRSRAAEHPRILLRVEELTSGRDLRGRIAVTGSHCEEYALLVRWAEKHLPRPTDALLSDPESAQQAALTYALLYQLSGDARFGGRAVDLTRALITSRQGRLPGFDWPHLPATVATVFDWTYDRLSPEDRQRLLYDILKRSIYVRNRKAADAPPPFDSTPYLKPLLFAALALKDEPEASVYAPGWTQYCQRLLSERVVPDLNEAGSQGAWLAGARGLGRELAVLECLEAWRSSTGRLPLEESPTDGARRLPTHFQNLGRRILYRLRPGLVLAGVGGDEPRSNGVPPALLYLLSHYEDDPTGRWLAEAVRVDHPLEPGSPGWLCDLRSRILWLDKGRRRVSPLEAELPLAAGFEDAGEAITRSTWDLTQGDGTWCLLTVAPAGAPRFPCWNPISLVRGDAALAVDVDVAAAPGSPFRDRWFGSPWAQNTVIDAGPGSGTGVDFVLESCQAGDGFSYARGRVSKRVRGKKEYRFTRSLVVFPEGLVVLHDHVAGAEERPTWLLHTLDEPRLLGRVRTIVGLPGGGVRESDDARGATWQTGRSQAYLLIVLPHQRRMRTIGGKDYEFWTEATGENDWPTRAGADGSPEPYSPEELRRLEVGTWRIEVVPTQSGEATDFVTVLATGPTGGPEPRASVREDANAITVTALWGEREYQVEFRAEGGVAVVVRDTRSGKTTCEGTVRLR